MGGVDEDGLISGLKEEELITNEEMDTLVKEVGVALPPLLPGLLGPRSRGDAFDFYDARQL